MFDQSNILYIYIYIYSCDKYITCTYLEKIEKIENNICEFSKLQLDCPSPYFSLQNVSLTNSNTYTRLDFTEHFLLMRSL